MAIFGSKSNNAEKISDDETEVRSDYRAETNGLLATLATPQGEVVANVHNISTRGLMASSATPPRVGDRIDLKVDSLPWVHGQVRWVKDNRFGVLLFSALPVGAFRIADQGRGRRPRPPRYIVRIPAYIEGPGVARSATIQNVSHSGLALETGLPLNPGKALTVTIAGLPPMTGRVRWSRGSRCGILLEQPLDQDVLDQLIKTK